MPANFYFTYIVASKSRTLYIGVTNNLLQRIFQHKQKTFPGFTAKYNCTRLVWFERYIVRGDAIYREKELKGWLRAKKLALIAENNPTWEDLSEPWYPHLIANNSSPEQNRPLSHKSPSS
ncbi:GIY-YIG nuclease family protein [Terracidiphilus gabretensis]|uniref:GIY-YIG nuclease family protein n=1 Tax=Terracidiphilus gabretensis TaxID=1577687 RepID=UPI00071B50C0|nr:GIY-YIG nuclease family protein [Terracidiphilus gabretensis]